MGPVLGPQEQHSHNEGVDIDDQIVVQLVRPEIAASSKGQVSMACNMIADTSVRAMNDEQDGRQHDGWFGCESSDGGPMQDRGSTIANSAVTAIKDEYCSAWCAT